MFWFCCFIPEVATHPQGWVFVSLFKEDAGFFDMFKGRTKDHRPFLPDYVRFLGVNSHEKAAEFLVARDDGADIRK